MFHVCPLCNGLISPDFHCPICLNPSRDRGKREDYVGPYAPYQEEVRIAAEGDASYELYGSNSDSCVHILYCEHCHTMTYIDALHLDIES